MAVAGKLYVNEFGERRTGRTDGRANGRRTVKRTADGRAYGGRTGKQTEKRTSGRAEGGRADGPQSGRTGEGADERMADGCTGQDDFERWYNDFHRTLTIWNDGTTMFIDVR